jgi:hypothetical protein
MNNLGMYEERSVGDPYAYAGLGIAAVVYGCMARETARGGGRIPPNDYVIVSAAKAASALIAYRYLKGLTNANKAFFATIGGAALMEWYFQSRSRDTLHFVGQAGYEGGPVAMYCPRGTKATCAPPPLTQLVPLTGYDDRHYVGAVPPNSDYSFSRRPGYNDKNY